MSNTTPEPEQEKDVATTDGRGKPSSTEPKAGTQGRGKPS